MKRFSYKLKDSTPRGTLLWNTAGSLVNAMYPVVIMALVTRLCGTDTAGIFSITFSVSQMMYMVGCFEMNNVLVTSARDTIGLRATIWFRLGSNLLMILCAAGFAAIQGFTGEKAVTFALLIGYMGLLSWAELCESHMFHNRHLDLAGRSLAINQSVGTLLFCVTLGLTRSLYAAIAAMCATTALWLMVYSIPYTRAVKPAWKGIASDGRTIARLIRLCLPLLISHVVLSYIINAPKLAIDTHLGLTEQSYYGYLIMPASCVNLLSLLVVRPQMPNLASAYHSGQKKVLGKLVAMLLGWDALIIAGVLLGGWFLGIPVLSVFYGVDLSGLEGMLCLLLLGGGFFACATLLDVVATAIEIQHWNLPLYLLSALAALLTASPLVARFQLLGAALAYVLCMLFIALGSGILVLVKLLRWSGKADLS